MGTADLDKRTVEVAYARRAPIYDAVCGPVMVKGRRAACAVGCKIVEVGVGAGPSFDDYDVSTEITCISLRADAEEGTGKNRERVLSSYQGRHSTGAAQGGAARSQYPDLFRTNRNVACGMNRHCFVMQHC